jgi:2,5-diketo-D-gluconate reductase B
MGYDSLMIDRDERIEVVRGMRVSRSGSGPGRRPERTPRRACGTVGLLRQAINTAPVICDQVESHPFLDQDPLFELARENEVLISAYSPLAHGRVPDDQTLRWIGESRRENFEIFDFDLGQPERDEIDLLPTDVRTANPPWAPDWNA